MGRQEQHRPARALSVSTGRTGAASTGTARGTPQASGVPAVRLTGVRRMYGQLAAVDGVDLEIAEGEFFTMLGPSGSGKTTLLRMIAGFERPDAGTVELAGVDVTREPPYARNVNTVFQDYALFPHMNVLENVEYGLRVAPGAPRRSGGAARRRRSRWCGWPGSAAAGRSSCRAGSGSGSRSPARSSTSRRCSCSTSRSARST